MFEEWIKDRETWLIYLTTLPGWDDPKATMDRINNDAGYAPENIRFVSHKKQQNNKRQTVWVEYDGKRMSGTEFYERYCPRYKNKSTVLRKIKEGLSPQEIISDQTKCKGAYRTSIRPSELWTEKPFCNLDHPWPPDRA